MAASVLAPALGASNREAVEARQLLSNHDLALPDVADVEVAAVLRKAWLGDLISEDALETAFGHLSVLPAIRYSTKPLLRRIFELRENVSPYDACYVALAELLRCDLVTADKRLTRAPGLRCNVRTM